MSATHLEAVREAIRGELGVKAPVELETDLLDDLALDSLALLTLAVALENRFEICLELDPYTGATRVADVVASIERGLVLAGSGT